MTCSEPILSLTLKSPSTHRRERWEWPHIDQEVAVEQHQKTTHRTMTMLRDAATAILRKFRRSRQVTRPSSASEAPCSNALQVPVNPNDCSLTDVDLGATIGSKGFGSFVDAWAYIEDMYSNMMIAVCRTMFSTSHNGQMFGIELERGES